MPRAGQVQEEDLNRTMKASGGAITFTVYDMKDITLRSCETFEESPKSTSCTIILRGGAEQFMEETEMSLHDSIMIFPIFQFLVRFNTEGILMFDRFKVATAGYNKELCRTLPVSSPALSLAIHFLDKYRYYMICNHCKHDAFWFHLFRPSIYIYNWITVPQYLYSRLKIYGPCHTFIFIPTPSVKS